MDLSGHPGKPATVPYEVDTSRVAVDSLTDSPRTLLANGAVAAGVTATVRDAWGNLVGSGVTVTFSGGITGTPTTDSSGKATLNTPTRTVPGTINVVAKANDSDPGKSVVVTYEMDMSSIKVTSLVADPASIVANGTATTTITATVTDGWGNAVGAGIPVSWSTDLGTFVAQDAATNDSGKAVATLQAGAVVGTATVHAIVNEMVASVGVTLMPTVQEPPMSGADYYYISTPFCLGSCPNPTKIFERFMYQGVVVSEGYKMINPNSYYASLSYEGVRIEINLNVSQDCVVENRPELDLGAGVVGCKSAIRVLAES